MTPRPAAPCTHERRHGTTVCLYCRMEEREAVRAKRKQALLKFGGMAGAGALVIVGVVAAITAVRGGDASGDAVAAPAVATTPSEQDAPAAPVEQAGTPRVAAVASPALIAIAAGRTSLEGGLYAERIGDTVFVHFDTPATRTRRSDKFERVVRETLPVVLGDAGRAAVEQLAPGALVRGGELLASLDAGPMRIGLPSGATAFVTPGSRPGEDGPLVVSYRLVVAREVPQG